ncbi:MAG: class I SAM-dependent methyltransferase [Thermoanaerobaculia bacterium]
MDPNTVSTLTRLNTGFYDRFAESFSRTRQAPWPGWARVLETWRRLRSTSPAGEAASILDLGCGNGRFGLWLGEELEQPHDYTGVDSSARLVDIVRSTLPSRAGVRGELVVADLVSDDLDEHLGDRSFDLLTLFGLLHHVPAFERRRALLEDLQKRLAPDGLMAMTFWQFADHERFRRRFVDWEKYNREASEPVDPTDLEAEDYLLRWGETDGCRYCHFADPSEAARLVGALDLEIVETFRSDGDGGDLNLYYLLRKNST